MSRALADYIFFSRGPVSICREDELLFEQDQDDVVGFSLNYFDGITVAGWFGEVPEDEEPQSLDSDGADSELE
jgi:hypothetical protein